MDTLCIPVGTEYSEARNLAILSLTRVFSDASTVLVLDMELVDVSITVSYLERELRMITSDWMRRVWTLQEALLTRPGNLYWQFKEQALAGDEIWVNNDEHDPLCISYRMSAFERRLPALSTTPRSTLSLSNDFLDVIYALRYRSLSRIEDETICIAPILGFGRAELLQTKDPLERIRIFLSLWGEIPSYVLFIEGERMDRPGCRWLPTSFIRGIHKSTVSRAPEQFTKAGPEGLYVTYPGIFLPPKSELTSLYCNIGIWNDFDGLWHTVKDLGRIFESQLPPAQQWATYRRDMHRLIRPAFILEYPSQYSEKYIVAVLVDVSREQDGVFYAQYLCRVWLTTCDFGGLEQTKSGKNGGESWPKGWYEEKIKDYTAEDQTTGLHRAQPPSREMFQVTATSQCWCVG